MRVRAPRLYRSVGVMLDRGDAGLALTVSLWWWDFTWEWRRIG